MNRARSFAVSLLSVVLAAQGYSLDAVALIVNLDEFAVVRNGTTIFDDSFDRNITLNGGSGTRLSSGTTFSDNTPATYIVQGSILETTANNGQAQLNTANGRLIVQPPPVRQTVNAGLLSGTDPNGPHTLTPATTFSAIGLFDLVIPSVVLGTYAVDITSVTASPGLEVQERIRQTATGLMLQFLWIDEAGNQTIITQTAPTSAELSDPQLELGFSHDSANGDVVTALYAFGSGNTLATFNGTLTALGNTDSSTDVFTSALNFVQPHFFDSEPVPEPSSLIILALALGTLGVIRRYTT